jgi:hypothetical protein
LRSWSLRRRREMRVRQSSLRRCLTVLLEPCNASRFHRRMVRTTISASASTDQDGHALRSLVRAVEALARHLAPDLDSCKTTHFHPTWTRARRPVSTPAWCRSRSLRLRAPRRALQRLRSVRHRGRERGASRAVRPSNGARAHPAHGAPTAGHVNRGWDEGELRLLRPQQGHRHDRGAALGGAQLAGVVCPQDARLRGDAHGR